MRTRNSNFSNNSNVTIPRRQNKGRAPNIVEPELRTIVAPMAERTMEELLRAPTEGYEEAIVLPEINADHFEIKTNLLQLVQANPFYGRESENPHAHINSFKRITSTLRFRNVPNDETFSEAWERFKELLRACPHHGFTELTQVDTFYNGLNENEQDSLNAAAGGNLLSKTTREALNIIENKSKVRYSRNKSNASRMNATTSKTDERIDKLANQLSTLVEIVSKKVVTPAPVKAVKESCVTCGGAHSWYNCSATDNNQASVCATTGTYNQVNPPNRVSNQMAPPDFAPVQNNGQNRFNQNQGQGNNFNRGNNFHGNQGFQAQNNHAPNLNNDQMLKNMQNQINSLKGYLKNEIQNTIKSQQAVMMNQQTTFQNNLQNMIYGLFQNQASTSGTIPSNTIPNPKGEMKAITTRSGVAYEGPSILTNHSPKRVVERETKETTDKEQTNFQGSIAQIPPSVIPISIPEPDVPKTLPKTTPIPESNVPKSLPKSNIPYPSRRDDQKSRDKSSNQMEKIFQIFQDLRFDISFADALLLMPRFAPMIKSLLMNKEKLLELAKIPLNENCSEMLLKKLPKKLGDPGKFLIPYFVVVDFEADPRVPLILGRSFLRTSRALINVYEGELVLRDGNKQITFHVDDTSKHPQKHINESIKMVNDSYKDSFKRFTVELALVCSPSPEDTDDEKEKQEVKNLAEPTAKRQTRITPCLKNFRVICKESIFHLNKTPQVSLVFAITSTLPTIEPEDSLIMGDEYLSTFRVEEIVPIPRESKDSSGSDSENILLSSDDSVTFSNPLFESNDEYVSSDINPLFDEALEDIECRDSYDSNLDESTFLVTLLFDSNGDECLALRDDIKFLLHHDPSTPLKSVASILEGFI
ncbi:reverse transcriptase domain-containing protein, partial [Tanacetum coccineum]